MPKTVFLFLFTVLTVFPALSENVSINQKMSHYPQLTSYYTENRLDDKSAIYKYSKKNNLSIEGIKLNAAVTSSPALSEDEKTHISRKWLFEILTIPGIVLLLLLFFNRKLKIEINKKVMELKQNEGMFHTIFDNSIQLMEILDSKGTLKAANPAAIDMTGVSEAQVIGMPFWQTPWWRHSAVLQDKLKESINMAAKGEQVQFETVHIDKTGKERIIDFSLIPVRNNDGDPKFIIAVGYDMTHIHEIEDRDRQLQKMEAIGTLAGGIAHDFNNILAALFGYLDLATLEEHDNIRLQEAHSEIRAASNRAKELVGQILTFSRKGSVTKKPVQLSLVLTEVIKLIRSSLPSTISIDQRIHCDEYILANSTQIHQVVMNICTNAYHAMEGQNSGLLSISLKLVNTTPAILHEHPGLPEGKYLELKICDTGEGMDSSTSKQVFNPYFTTKISGKGTGLGLSLVHTIITSHDGVVSVKSTPGIGTTFTTLFPKIDRPVEVAVAPQKKSVVFDNNMVHILFVDDEELIVKSTTRFLEHSGFTVTPFTDSTEALATFEAAPDKFSMVITDMTMPLLDGVEMIAEIKKIRPKLPVILCSGFNQREHELRENMPEITKFLQKPIGMKQLIQEVRILMSQQS